MDIKKDGLKSLYTMSKNYNNLDKKLKKALSATMSLFFDEGFRSFRNINNSDQWSIKLSDIRSKFLSE